MLKTTTNLSRSAIEEAASRLRAGERVAFVTETVYGLGANALDASAVTGIYADKGRPSHNPLIVHVADFSVIAEDVILPATAQPLIETFWPGALTLVLRRSPRCRLAPAVSAGGESVAVRIPAHPIARALLQAVGLPIAAPSANRSGEVSPTTAEHVRVSLPHVWVLDGGACPVGIESTVLDMTEATPRLLRPGSITQTMIEAVLGMPIAVGAGQGELRSPGLLASHYAPHRPVRLNVLAPHPDEALLAFGHTVPKGARTTLNLSVSGDLVEAAANLFAMLHALDTPEHRAIAVMPLPMEGVGVAINDRLARAATPRS